MRILHVAHDYLPYQVAGVEVYTNRVARRQAEHHTVGVLHARLDPKSATGHLEERDDDGVSILALTQNRDHRRFEQTWRHGRLAGPIGESIERFRPDVIHVQHLMNLGTAWLERARQAGVPIVMTLHDQWFACAAGGQRFTVTRRRCEDLVARRCVRCTATQVGPALAIRKGRQRAVRPRSVRSSVISSGVEPGTLARSVWSEMVAMGGAGHIEARWKAMRALPDVIDLFIAPSHHMRRAATRFGWPEDRVTYLAHGLPSVESAQRRLPDRATRFGSISSLVPHKGIHHLVEAFGEMPRDATLDIYGSIEDAPAYVRELERLARHPGIAFRGQRPPEDVSRILGDLDVLVAPSIWEENAPLNVHEAFQQKRPVVASRLGGHIELLRRSGGLLYEADDPSELARALLRLHQEPGLARALGTAAPAVASIETHVEALEELYDAVLSGG